MKKSGSLILVFCALAILPGCAAKEIFAGSIVKTAYDFFQREDINLVEKSYAAADYLEPQMSEFVSKSAPIAIQPLTLVGEPEITSDLGRKVTQQVGERLRQLGYHIILDEQMPGAVKGVSVHGHEPQFVLGGTYDTARRQVPISLRVVSASDGRVVGSFDYMIPRTGDIRTESESRPSITRVIE